MKYYYENNILENEYGLMTAVGGFLKPGTQNPDYCVNECQKLGILKNPENTIFYGLGSSYPDENIICLCGIDFANHTQKSTDKYLKIRITK